VSEGPALTGSDAPPIFRPGDRVRWTSGSWTFEAAPLDPGDNLAAIHADPLASALSVSADSFLTLRARRSGDRFRPRGSGGHSQKLSDTLINLRVPAAWRDRVPLLVIGDEIAWFVAPTAEGLRGRVGDSFAVPDAGLLPGRVIVVVRWRPAFEKS
jgi:tRNA(Ile)-lysidine synthetase-like protein